MTARILLDFAAVVGLIVLGFAVIDLWRRGERWAAILLSASAWVILLVWVLVLLR
jgi:hypothetical protein